MPLARPPLDHVEEGAESIAPGVIGPLPLRELLASGNARDAMRVSCSASAPTASSSGQVS